jgi:hypothetical protein
MKKKRGAKTYVTPGLVCPYCGKKMDRSTETLRTGGKPKAGDVTVCIYCVKVCVFTKELGLRKPTFEERLQFTKDPLITNLQMVVAGAPGIRA